MIRVKLLYLYSPMVVVFFWAACVGAGADGKLLHVIVLIALAATLGLHIREERDRHRV